MINEQLQQFKERALQLRDASKQGREATAVLTRRNRLREQRQMLEARIHSWTTLRGLNIADVDHSTRSALALGQLDRFRKAFAKAPSATVESAEATDFTKTIDGIARDIEIQGLEAWKTYVQSKKPQLDVNALSKLEKLCPTSVQRIWQLRNRLDTLEQNLPADADTVAQLGELIKRIDAEWNKLAVDPEISTFLSAVSSYTGAPLRLLTDKVLHWIDEQQLKDSLVVKYR